MVAVKINKRLRKEKITIKKQRKQNKIKYIQPLTSEENQQVNPAHAQ